LQSLRTALINYFFINRQRLSLNAFTDGKLWFDYRRERPSSFLERFDLAYDDIIFVSAPQDQRKGLESTPGAETRS
jgi:hypothetical protein